MAFSEIEFEPTADPVAVLRDSAGRLASMDEQTAAEAADIAHERAGGAEDDTGS